MNPSVRTQTIAAPKILRSWLRRWSAAAAARRGATMVAFLIASHAIAHAAPPTTLKDTKALMWQGDLSARMVAGIDTHVTRKIAASVGLRHKLWNRAPIQADYAQSVDPNRQHFQQLLGVVDPRIEKITMERFGDEDNPALVAETQHYTVWQVRWPVLEGVFGEGLLIEPKGSPIANVVALTDADQTPEQIVGLQQDPRPGAQFAHQLAAAGCRVLIPVLVSRGNQFAGNPKVRAGPLDQSHREWLYRPAFEMGRHLIGYELQKVLAAVDWFQRERSDAAASGERKRRSIGIVGYGEGGLLAFYAAAIDTRLDACLVSGYFGPRERLWAEPIYRNVWGLLREFGDAEIASLIAPRKLVIQYSAVPEMNAVRPLRRPDGSPTTRATPGELWTPSLGEVKREYQRAVALVGDASPDFAVLQTGDVSVDGGRLPITSDGTLVRFLNDLGTVVNLADHSSAPLPTERRRQLDIGDRQHRQITQIESHTQQLLRDSASVRDKLVLSKLRGRSLEDMAKAALPLREKLKNEVIGHVDDPLLPPNPHTRLRYDRPTWLGYDVVLDVWDDVFAWGVLLVPKDLKPGERRPVVVCQHGLEGLPADTIEGDHRAYHDFAAKLCERGFVVFAPHNPYRGYHKFRVLQRKANPLKLSLFSFIVGQHRQILNWLGTLEFVDATRIGFYGLSYGGKTAMRVPALLDGYCLSICSADFNDWICKNVTIHQRYSYVFTTEYEMPEFNLGHTFNYAEMAYLIFPRPFMVERGHDDGVAPDRWVAAEYSKIRRFYAKAGLSDRTEIEWFDGPHTIHGVGTFEFLHKHLQWPRREASGRAE